MCNESKWSKDTFITYVNAPLLKLIKSQTLEHELAPAIKQLLPAEYCRNAACCALGA